MKMDWKREERKETVESAPKRKRERERVRESKRAREKKPSS